MDSRTAELKTDTGLLWTVRFGRLLSFRERSASVSQSITDFLKVYDSHKIYYLLVLYVEREGDKITS